ncbi:hypothetical protein ACUR5C_10630 [Aliikangiella sp. IMCC44653]
MQSIAQLDEALRLQYLEALNVTQWVLRDEPDFVVTEQACDETPMASGEATSQASANPANSAKREASSSQVNTQPSDSVKPAEPATTQQVIPASATTAEPANPGHTKLKTDKPTSFTISQHFLKLVNWSQNKQADCKVLIICRHQTDQPAQSFAKASAPSQFMQDYLTALNDLVMAKGIELNTQLAHLSEAGLGADCQKIETVFTDLKPRLVLMLGDEAVKNTLGPEHNVATTRNQVLSLFGEVPIVVSYHPYTLIKNPHLKKSAFEDLVFISQMLAQSAV